MNPSGPGIFRLSDDSSGSGVGMGRKSKSFVEVAKDVYQDPFQW